jgi:retron-type reverse transcriptase
LEIASFVPQYDVTSIIETKLDTNVTTSSLLVPGFHVVRQDRTANGGGIVTYIKEKWQAIPLDVLQTKYTTLGMEVTLTKISLQKPIKLLVIVSIYRPPNANTSWFETLNELLNEVMLIGPLVMMGDINIDLLKPKTSSARRICKLLALAGLKTHALSPTRISKTSSTCLDIIATPREIECTTYSTLALAASDHLPVVAELGAASNTGPLPVLRRSFKHVDMIQLQQQATNITLDINLDRTADELLEDWHRSMIAILDVAAPMRSFPACRKNCPWFSADLQRLIRKRDSIARKIQKCSTQELLTECNLLKRQIKSRMRRAAKEYGSSLISEKKDTSAAWKFLRAVTFTTTKGERTTMDPIALNEHFAKVVTSENGVPDPPSGCDALDSFTLAPLRQADILRQLSMLSTTTATGPDEISAKLLKQLAPAVASNLTLIMNRSIEQCSVPTDWKKANVVAIWKAKGSKSDASNYRPISILPVLARLFERLVALQLTQYCSAHDIIPPEQFGFRAKSSCETALLTALENWMGEVDKGMVVGALLVDLSKAFDTVSHQILIKDLQEIGCDGEAINWFHSYLTGRQQRIKQGGEVTEWKPVSRGVPQGSCLSPLLFNVYVRQLPKATATKTVQFADDITNSVADADDHLVVRKLTESFQFTKSFCEQKELIINTEKTQFIIFKSPTRRLSKDLEIVLDNCSITPAESVKLLGVVLDRHLTFGEHIEKVVKKCTGILGILSRAAPRLPRNLLCNAYVALVRTHLEYSSATFAGASKTHLKKLDTVQKVAARIICRMPRNCHAAPLIDSLHLESLEVRRHAHVIKLVNAIISKDTHPALENLFIRAENGSVADGRGNNHSGQTRIGRSRFSVVAKNIANS